jgi:hypothetical protein
LALIFFCFKEKKKEKNREWKGDIKKKTERFFLKKKSILPEKETGSTKMPFLRNKTENN